MEASRIHRLHRFDVAHQVSLGTVSAPPLLWQLPVPFIWGPVGGGQTAPPAFKRYFGSTWHKEVVRNFRTWLLPFLPALRRAVHRSAAILAANKETMHLLEKAGARRVHLFPDTGSLPELIVGSPPKPGCRSEFTLLWVGRLEHRKALPLALEALAQVRDIPVRLLVAGDGPLCAKWKRLAGALCVEDRVQFLGQVSWSRMPELYRQADAFLFTSLRDTFGSQVLEAMSQSLPLITLDHQGVGSLIPPEASVKVPVTTPAETVAALAKGIRFLAQSPDVCYRMGESAVAYAKNQTWELRVKKMNCFYDQYVTKHNNPA